MSRRSYDHGKYIRPERCLEGKPTPQSVLFCSRFINLTCISKYTGYSIPTLSRIFKGQRNPSLACAKAVAIALDMDLISFCSHLDDHVGRLKPHLTKAS